MSNPGTPILPSITGNQAADRLIRSAILAIAAAATGVIMTWLNAHGFHDPNLSLMISGAIVSVLGAAAVMIWGYINGARTEAAAKQAVAIGVQSGINLTIAGKALANDGSVVSKNDGSTPPKLVTEKTAADIVANFGPAPSEIAKA